MEPAEFQLALESLRQGYERALPDKLAEIDSLWRALVQDIWEAERFRTFVRLVHSLAGSGATFGFDEPSTAARTLEHYVKAFDIQVPPTPAQQAQVERMLAQLNRAITSPVSATLPPVPTGSSPSFPVASSPPVLAAAPDSLLSAPYVLIYERDSERAHNLQEQLGYFGYRTRFLEDVGELPGAVEKTQPAALVLDWDAAKEQAANALTIFEELQATHPTLPIVFVSNRDDLSARLEAVRNRATAYLVKPVAPSLLIETLDVQMTSSSGEPYRILIVEDDEGLAAWSAAILNEAGVLTLVVTDPMLVVASLIDFRPDLILTDVHMPGVTGLELAAVLRQQEAYVSIPIVFLSSETDVDQKLSAMLLGGDDFLFKPIEPFHLLTTVTSRIQRARILRGLAERDSLTGLLNHTRFKEQLAIKVARATRTHTDLSFGMLDIDLFKGVNDTYGHPTGDRVIKSLARLLKQRLRKTDILGRYGGEEFAVILPETNCGVAYAVMEEIRKAFSQIRQQAGGVEFTVTVSGGIASVPPCLDAVELNEAADKGLYQAKRTGRNQISYAIDE